MDMITFSTEQQVAIDKCIDTNIYMAAGPGSGKSTTLAEIARTILHENPSNKIMLITFTNKSARDIVDKVNEKSDRIVSGTFHSIVFREMRVHNEINICDTSKRNLIIKKLFDCRRDRDLFDEVSSTIDKAKRCYPIKQCEITQKYNNELIKYNMYDFDDIINYGIDFIKAQPKNHHRLTHILVDELQDTSQSQLELLKAYQQVNNCNVIGVGDLDQSIYEWRGARPQNVKEFISVFKCQVIGLGLNFRSDINIVSHSKKLIENNTDRIEKNLRPFSYNKGSVTKYRAYDVNEEIRYVINKCKSLSNKEVTILYRNRLNKMKLEYELRKNHLKYTVNDSTEIVDRSAFKVLICMMKIASGTYDIYDLEIATKGMKLLGQSTIDKIKNSKEGIIVEDNGQTDLFAQNNPKTFNEEVHNIALTNKSIKRGISQIIKLQDKYKELHDKDSKLNILVQILPKHIIKSFDIPIEIMEFMCDITKEYGMNASDIRNLCNDFGLNATEEVTDNEALIELSTIHGYKGSEKEIIIMPFCNWDFKPDDNVKNIIESERRLFYVGISRAKSKLYMTYSGNKTPLFIREMGV